MAAAVGRWQIWHKWRVEEVGKMGSKGKVPKIRGRNVIGVGEREVPKMEGEKMTMELTNGSARKRGVCQWEMPIAKCRRSPGIANGMRNAKCR
jgi:hypothetical protein